jgi:hypothetical protein
MRTLGFLGLLPFMVASLACSTAGTRTETSGEMSRVEGPGAVFFSVEAAVMDAMAYVHGQRYPMGRPELIAGTITRVDGGFSYTAPVSSRGHSALSRPFVRFRLGPDDAASFLVYSCLHDRNIDRENEAPSKSVMQIVDELDPEHRPLFLLTPSLNVVQYHGERIRSIARLGEGGAYIMAATDR